MDVALALGFALTGGGLTAAIILLHKRISWLEDRLLKLAEAGVHISNGFKLLSETQNGILTILKQEVQQRHESTTT